MSVDADEGGPDIDDSSSISDLIGSIVGIVGAIPVSNDLRGETNAGVIRSLPDMRRWRSGGGGDPRRDTMREFMREAIWDWMRDVTRETFRETACDAATDAVFDMVLI